MERHFCAAAFIINPIDRKLLLVKHKKFNKWVQPGGHIENLETPEEAVLREVFEETGLKIKLVGNRFPREEDFIRPLAIQKNKRADGGLNIDFMYVAIPTGEGNLQHDPNESYEIGWFDRIELDKMDIFNDIKITYDYILENLKIS